MNMHYYVYGVRYIKLVHMRAGKRGDSVNRTWMLLDNVRYLYRFVEVTSGLSGHCLLARSVVELLQEGASGLSVLRTFRLLRILKLVRFMPALKYQLVVMLRTMDSVATFCALLVLFIFIFRSAGRDITWR